VERRYRAGRNLFQRDCCAPVPVRSILLGGPQTQYQASYSCESKLKRGATRPPPRSDTPAQVATLSERDIPVINV